MAGLIKKAEMQHNLKQSMAKLWLMTQSGCHCLWTAAAAYHLLVTQSDCLIAAQADCMIQVMVQPKS